MAIPGKTTTYDLTVGVVVDIEDQIQLLSPFDVPLQGANGANGLSVLSTGSCFEKKVEWLEENLLLPKSLIGVATTTGDGWIVVTTGDRLKFSTGDVLMVNAERMRITGYGTTADSLTVTRGFNSSTAGTATVGLSVLSLGAVLGEGADPELSRVVDRVNLFNMTQIFGPTQVSITGTEDVVRKYGTGTGEFQHQIANRTKEQFIQIEQAILYGQRIEDSGNSWRQMGGMIYYITTNNDTATTTITESTLLTQLQACFDLGGNPNVFTVGSKTKRIMSGFNTNLTIEEDRTADARGYVVNYFDSDFGRVSLVLNRWIRTADGFGFNRDQAELDTLRPMQFQMLAKTGDSMKGQILCEKTMRYRREKHSFRFSALT